MSIFRSYFSKNNTIIQNNKTNNAHNPVTEISYGAEYNSLSRFIFEIDLSNLVEKINRGEILSTQLTKHTLNLKNSISMSPQYIGGKFVDGVTQRATSFKLDLFEVNEDWSEGNGYEFYYIQPNNITVKESASNWFNKKTDELWNTNGIYLSGSTNIIHKLEFDNGNEDISVDITPFITDKLNKILNGDTQTNFGLGLKFDDQLESEVGYIRKAIAFHTKCTNTFFEPYIETSIDDEFSDNREYFFLDEDNTLVTTINNQNGSLVINNVEIYDFNGVLINTINNINIKKINNSTYSIPVKITSDVYPDAVIFNDVWNYTYNNITKAQTNDFYLISSDIINENSMSEFDNYNITVQGIKFNENILRGDIKKINVSVKELYKYYNDKIPLDIEYRIYIKQAKNYNIDIIPTTKMNRFKSKYQLDLDTSWMISQDYILEIKIMNNGTAISKKNINFTIMSDLYYTKTAKTI